MKIQKLVILGTATAVFAVVGRPCLAFENHVTVESKTFSAGQTACTVGVYFENSVGLTGVVLPLEIRSVNSGVYPQSGFVFSFNRNSRIGQSPLLLPDSAWAHPLYFPLRRYAVPDTGASCGGPSANRWSIQAANMDYVSPDAVMFVAITTGDPEIGDDIDLDPGADVQITDSAGLWIRFNVGNTPGVFEIDTCCIQPANHILYVDVDVNQIVPSFDKGTITVTCQCPCAGDPNCDGIRTNILDLIEAVNVAFRGKPATFDPGCPYAMTDVNCDGKTDVVDVVSVALVSLAGFDPALMFCEPCE